MSGRNDDITSSDLLKRRKQAASEHTRYITKLEKSLASKAAHMEIGKNVDGCCVAYNIATVAHQEYLEHPETPQLAIDKGDEWLGKRAKQQTNVLTKAQEYYAEQCIQFNASFPVEELMSLGGDPDLPSDDEEGDDQTPAPTGESAAGTSQPVDKGKGLRQNAQSVQTSSVAGTKSTDTVTAAAGGMPRQGGNDPAPSNAQGTRLTPVTTVEGKAGG